MIFSHVYGSHWEEFSLLFFGADCLFSLFYFLFVFLDVFSFLYGRIAYSFRVSGVINGLSVNRTFFFFDKQHQETVSDDCQSQSQSLSYLTSLSVLSSIHTSLVLTDRSSWLTQHPGGTQFRRAIATFTSPHILPPPQTPPPSNTPSPPSHPSLSCCVAVDSLSHSIVSIWFVVSRSLEGLRRPVSFALSPLLSPWQPNLSFSPHVISNRRGLFDRTFVFFLVKERKKKKKKTTKQEKKRENQQIFHPFLLSI